LSTNKKITKLNKIINNCFWKIFNCQNYRILNFQTDNLFIISEIKKKYFLNYSSAFSAMNLINLVIFCNLLIFSSSKITKKRTNQYGTITFKDFNCNFTKFALEKYIFPNFTCDMASYKKKNVIVNVLNVNVVMRAKINAFYVSKLNLTVFKNSN
jgi:hypothetical protein